MVDDFSPNWGPRKKIPTEKCPLHLGEWRKPIHFWLVVSTPLKNISQIGNLPQVGVKIKNIYKYLKPPPRFVWAPHFETYSLHGPGKYDSGILSQSETLMLPCQKSCWRYKCMSLYKQISISLHVHTFLLGKNSEPKYKQNKHSSAFRRIRMDTIGCRVAPLLRGFLGFTSSFYRSPRVKTIQ